MKNCLFLFFLLPILIYGIDKNTPVTRNLESERFKPVTFKEYLDENELQESSYQVVYKKKSKRNESFLIIVEENLYPLIEASITTYINDIQNEDLDAILITFTGNQPIDLKSVIQDYYLSDDIVGAILIGDLPSAWYEMPNDFDDDGYPDDDFVTFPIDLFYSDLDGYWYDLDANGVYDVHDGNLHPDIWIGRIKADILSWVNESEAINEYFERNHLFRNGMLMNPDKGLAYIDDDWSYWGDYYQENMEMVYQDVELINEINHTTADDYRNVRLQTDYEFIQVHVHSSPQAHYFYYNDGIDYELVHNTELPIIEPTAYFYNLFCCSNAHFETPDNMGSLYLLSNNNALAVLGSTKTGSMLGFENFYEPLSQQNTFGESFMRWWQQTVDTGSGSDWWERSWFYGMVLLGDPTLQLHYENENVIFVDCYSDGTEDGSSLHPFQTIQAAIENAESGNEVLIAPGVYYESINFLDKELTIRSIYGKETCIIDAQQNSVAVVIENQGTSQLQGVTIRNGSGTTGAGILCDNASPVITDVNMIDNVALNGAAIALMNGSNVTIKQTHFSSNECIESGIFYVRNSSLSIENCLVSGNSGNSCFNLESSSIAINFSTITENFAENDICLNATGETDIQFENSIFWSEEASDIVYDPDGEDYQMVITHCDIFGGESSVINEGNLIWEDSNITSNPQFQENFFLSRYSNCLGAAQQDTEVQFDFDGNIRPNPHGSNPDIGARESEQFSAALSLFHVRTNGSDEVGNGTPQNPFATLQKAIDTALDGDSILVHVGEYSNQVIWEDKELHVISEYHYSQDWSDVQQTILNAENSGTVMKMIDLNVGSFAGFTISNGQASHGGGIALFNSDIILQDLIIKENSASHGAGLFAQNSDSRMERILLYDNSASFDGGGISFFNSANTIINCTISDNYLENDLENGKNVYLVNSNPFIINSITYDEDISFGQINSNPYTVYSNTNPLMEGEGNISERPIFSDFYELSEDSPCIDTGVHFYEWNDLLIIDSDDFVGENVDMGCFEWNMNSGNEDFVSSLPVSIQNYPNPFNPSTTFFYSIPEDCHVSLTIYNIRGQKIKTLVNEIIKQGKYNLVWDGTNQQNKVLSSGIYMYKLQTDSKMKTGRCLLIK